MSQRRRKARDETDRPGLRQSKSRIDESIHPELGACLSTANADPFHRQDHAKADDGLLLRCLHWFIRCNEVGGEASSLTSTIRWIFKRLWIM